MLQRRRIASWILLALIAGGLVWSTTFLGSSASSKFDSVGYACASMFGGCGGGDGSGDYLEPLSELDLDDGDEPAPEYDPGPPDAQQPPATVAPTPPPAQTTPAPTTPPPGASPTTAAPTAAPEPNVFAASGVNPWVDTATDAESTFALDVDTGSYTIARRFLDEGSLPPAEAVRVEEIVNYLDYGYADPSEGDFAIELDGASTPFTSEEDDTRLVRVGIQSRRIDDADRKAAALTFVVDTSGSMDLENRLALVRQSLALLVEELRSGDTIAIVEYGSSARVVLEPTSVDDKVTILSAIDALVPSGSTNAEEGLRLGYEQAHAGFIEGGTNRVVLASDGVANVGTSDPEGLVQQLRDDADAGIQLVTVGFGMGNYNDVLMEQLADQGDGFYAYIDDYREAERLFRDELTGTLQTLALDTKTQVVFDPAVVTQYRLLGFENRDVADEDFRNDAVDAGEIGTGHAVTALYEVRLAPGTAPEATIATTFLRWESPDSGDVTEIDQVLTVDEMAPSFTESPPTMQRAAIAAYYAELLRQSPHVLERGLTMADVSQAAQSVLGAHGGDGRFDELAALVSTAAALQP